MGFLNKIVPRKFDFPPSDNFLNSFNQRGDTMATNPPSGDGHRNGMVKDRSQVFNPKNDRWTKRDSDNGRFMDQKSDGQPFKGVRKEK